MQFELITDRRIVDEAYRAILYTEQTVLDLGAKNRMNKLLEAYQGKPIQARYFCTDIQPGDLDFIADAQQVPIRTASMDAVICQAVIEHVQEPWSLASEIYRVLKPGGVAFLYAPFLFPYHAENSPDDEHVGGYDCYRFTLDGLRYLFRDFALMRVSPVEYGVLAWWRQAVNFRAAWTYPYVNKLHKWMEQRAGRTIGAYQATGYDIWLEK